MQEGWADQNYSRLHKIRYKTKSKYGTRTAKGKIRKGCDHERIETGQPIQEWHDDK